MAETVEIRIPDIGDSSDVEIIEMLVSEGDTVAVDDSLLTLESDKASMEVPAVQSGRIVSLKLKVGDTVNAGDVVGTMEVGGAETEASSESAVGTASASTAAAPGDNAQAAAAVQSDDASTIELRIPDIGDSKDVEIIELLVSVGDTVAVDDSLLTLESDKASMEVPAVSAGTILSLAVKVGDTVNSGDLIAQLQGRSGAGESPPAAAAAQPAAPPPPADTSAQVSDRGSVTPSPATQTQAPATSPTAHLRDEQVQLAHASPGVRRYAREHGTDLNLVEGTGPKGRILKDDVIAFIKQAMESAGVVGGRSSAGVAGGMGIPPMPEIDFTKFGPTERVELSRINKLSAENLHRAWLNVPMVTHHDEADITEMEAFRKDLKNSAGPDDPKVTGLAFHLKALALMLKKHPKFNSSLAADGQSLIMKQYYHIGIAVDTPAGLVVPVFRDVDKKSINELAVEMADVSARARAKKLKPDEMQGASMTISSLGGIGGTAFTPIVNAPEVAILGITRARMQPVWNGKEFTPRLMCPLDLSYDHRVIDGAVAARFMADYCTAIADIRRLLL